MTRTHATKLRGCSPRAIAAVALVATLAALVLAAAADAKSYSLPQADVQVVVAPDGSLRVEEDITFAFSGAFTGAYRDIPIREGEAIDGVVVSEDGRPYRPGASAELGSSGAPGTFGTTQVGDALRVVWHYSAVDAVRTFTITYRFRHLAVAYDDVVDVNFKVWGDHWPVPLGRLTATLVLPGDASGPQFRGWGHPVWVRGDVQLAGDRVLLRALDVPAEQFVELRALFPRQLLESTANAKTARGAGFARILEEEREDARTYDRDRERIDEALGRLGRTALTLGLLATGPTILVLFGVWGLYGRERRSGYDREYEQEPPSELEPALVPSLLRQATNPGSHEFTATLFDLVRRGHFGAKPVTTARPIWAGLRTEDVADLEISAGTPVPLTPWEDAVADVVNAVIDGGSRPLSQFRDEIEDERTSQAKRFERFKERIGDAIRERRWFVNDGLKLIVPAAVALGAFGAIALWRAIDGFRPVAPRWSDVVLIALGICALVNAFFLFLSLTAVRLWRRRAPAAQHEAERWEAFRRYLADFPRLDIAPPASLELWERYLVYGIALGIAERVLQGAQLHMPEELHADSSIYWISPNGDLGSGASALGISDLSSGFGSALAPPSSGSGGGGGPPFSWPPIWTRRVAM